MCLAKAYARPVNGMTAHAAEPKGTNGALLLMENVVHVQVNGDTLTLRSLLGDTQSLCGRIASVDFSESKLILECVDARKAVEV
jgi:predicted RNA-binding protein